MLFNSFIFLFFLAVLLHPIIYLRPEEAEPFCQLYFYRILGFKVLCSLLLISSVIDYLVGRTMYHTDDKSRRKVVGQFNGQPGILGFFKYFNFFIDSFAKSMIHMFNHDLNFLHLNLILPVGISFYTFRPYPIPLTEKNSFLDFALFLFPLSLNW